MFRRLLLFVLLSIYPAPAQFLLPESPVLRVETGAHDSPIDSIAVNERAQLIATAVADEMVVRVWGLTDGRLRQTLRLPLPGQSTAGMDISADGKQLAVTAMYQFKKGERGLTPVV
jgi:hypothetical protein